MNKLYHGVVISLAVLGLFLFPSISSAHLDAGEDIVVGKYIVDFGYAPVGPTANMPVDLAINLEDAKTSNLIVPHHVWVRISQGDAVVFAGTFHPQAKNVTFKQSFAQAGDYNLDFQFFNSANVMIASTTANLTIGQLPSENQSNLVESKWLEFLEGSSFPMVMMLLSLWSLIWKGQALWRAAKQKSLPWFIVLLVVNTLGILDIIYLLISRSKPLNNSSDAINKI